MQVRSPRMDTLFHDGPCGLCHRAVKFILAHDSSENAFRSAPLQGETSLAQVSSVQRTNLPHSMVVRVGDGTLFLDLMRGFTFCVRLAENRNLRAHYRESSQN
jgi:predicted DCC family thiol-disulfide oxidoreductase YuxK